MYKYLVFYWFSKKYIYVFRLCSDTLGVDTILFGDTYYYLDVSILYRTYNIIDKWLSTTNFLLIECGLNKILVKDTYIVWFHL